MGRYIASSTAQVRRRKPPCAVPHASPPPRSYSKTARQGQNLDAGQGQTAPRVEEGQAVVARNFSAVRFGLSESAHCREPPSTFISPQRLLSVVDDEKEPMFPGKGIPKARRRYVKQLKSRGFPPQAIKAFRGPCFQTKEKLA